MTLRQHTRRISAWFFALNSRERLLVGASAIGVFAYLSVSFLGVIEEGFGDTQVRIARRQNDLEQVNQLLRRYQQLDSKLKKIKTKFESSQMTFEQVTGELDRVIKENLGDNNYELKKTHSPTEFGLEFEKQDFTLNIKKLTLDQLVKLLYALEQGKSPLFLGKVDITRSPNATEFSSTLEIFSIRKQA